MKGSAAIALMIVLTSCATPDSVRDREIGSAATRNIAAQVTSVIKDEPAWIPYQAYLGHMLGAIQWKWEKLLIDQAEYPPIGTSVTVKFTLNAQGETSSVHKVYGNSSALGQEACMDAISHKTNYGKWTDQMIADLGTSQDITIAFYYQK
jgi:hypothetical protein